MTEITTREQMFILCTRTILKNDVIKPRVSCHDHTNLKKITVKVYLYLYTNIKILVDKTKMM